MKQKSLTYQFLFTKQSPHYPIPWINQRNGQWAMAKTMQIHVYVTANETQLSSLHLTDGQRVCMDLLMGHLSDLRMHTTMMGVYNSLLCLLLVVTDISAHAGRPSCKCNNWYVMKYKVHLPKIILIDAGSKDSLTSHATYSTLLLCIFFSMLMIAKTLCKEYLKSCLSLMTVCTD